MFGSLMLILIFLPDLLRASVDLGFVATTIIKIINRIAIIAPRTEQKIFSGSDGILIQTGLGYLLPRTNITKCDVNTSMNNF